MPRKDAVNRSRADRSARVDLGFKAFLVGSLWLVLYLVDADITPGVSVATLAAVFGGDALRIGLERFTDRQ